MDGEAIQATASPKILSCNYKALNCLDKTYALKKEKELLKHHKKGWYILKLRCVSQVLYEYLTELEECDIKNQTSRIWVSSFGYPLRNQNQNRFDSSWHCSQFTQINFFLPPLKKNSPSTVLLPHTNKFFFFLLTLYFIISIQSPSSQANFLCNNGLLNPCSLHS